MKELKLFSQLDSEVGVEIVSNVSKVIPAETNLFMQVLVITIQNKRSKGGPSRYVAGIKPHIVAPIAKHLVPWLEQRGETKIVHPCFEDFMKVTLRRNPYNKENLPLLSASSKKRDDGKKFTVDAISTVVYGSTMEQLNKNVKDACNRIIPFFRYPTFKSEINVSAKRSSTNPKYLKMVSEALKQLQKATLRVEKDTFLDEVLVDESIEEIVKVITKNGSVSLQQLKLCVPQMYGILFKDFDYEPQVKEEEY